MSSSAHQITPREVGILPSSSGVTCYAAAVACPEHTYLHRIRQPTTNRSRPGELPNRFKLNNTAEALTDEEAFAAFRASSIRRAGFQSELRAVLPSALAAGDAGHVLSGVCR